MGYIFYSISDYVKSECYYKEALQRARRNIENGKERTRSGILALENNYANVLVQLGRYDEAIIYYQEALLEKERVVGKSGMETTGLLYNLGSVSLKLGEKEKALEYYEKARAIRTKVLGREHMEVIIVLSQIGNVYCAMEKFAKAKDIYTLVLKARAQELGTENEATLTTIMNQGFVLYKSGQYDVAFEFYGAALEHTSDYDWDLRAAIMHSMGNIQIRRKEYTAAIQSYMDALKLKRKMFGNQHQSVVRTLHNLGVVCCRQKLLDEAEFNLEEALLIGMKVLKPLHPEIGKLMIDLGKVYYKKKKFLFAKQYFSDALELLRDANLTQEHEFIKYGNVCLTRVNKRLSRRRKTVKIVPSEPVKYVDKEEIVPITLINVM